MLNLKKKNSGICSLSLTYNCIEGFFLQCQLMGRGVKWLDGGGEGSIQDE